MMLSRVNREATAKVNEQLHKRRHRSRRTPSDRKFECTHEGCGKSYSRAEHLYRHQLNYTPSQLFLCDFPNCYRSFVRQNLCIRHCGRHTTRGSRLHKRDSLANNSDDKFAKALALTSSPSSQLISPADCPTMAYPPVTSSDHPLSASLETTAVPLCGYTDFPGIISQPDAVLELNAISNVCPVFGGDTHKVSPFGMPDDFAVWLFDEPFAPLGHGTVPFLPN